MMTSFSPSIDRRQYKTAERRADEALLEAQFELRKAGKQVPWVLC